MKILKAKKNLFNTFKFTKALVLLLFIPLIGYSQYYNDVLSYRFNGTPTNGIKIHTNMPFASNQQMPTIMIEGYDYGTSKPIDIKIVYYIYGDKYIKYKATSTSSYTPDIYLSEENGKVVVFIDDRSYYVRFHVRVYAYLSEQAAWFTGWTYSDTPKASGVPTGHEVLVPYDVVTQDDNVLIGLNAPAYGVKIKTNFPGYTGGWSRGFNIANRNNTENHIQFGAIGSATNGIDGLSYGFIGKNYDNTYMAFRPSGKKVGIGTNTPSAKLDVNGRATCHTSFTVGQHNDDYRGLVVDNAGSYAWKLMELKNVQGTKMTVFGNGKIKIGNVSTTSNNYKLFVEKGILTEKVKVAVKSTSDWSDYVFEKDYEVMSITELENFVAENKHLPNVPSAEEMVKSGLDVATMDAKLLEKIEEAHLYIIELHKEIEALKTQINDKQ